MDPSKRLKLPSAEFRSSANQPKHAVKPSKVSKHSTDHATESSSDSSQLVDIFAAKTETFDELFTLLRLPWPIAQRARDMEPEELDAVACVISQNVLANKDDTTADVKKALKRVRKEGSKKSDAETFYYQVLRHYANLDKDKCFIRQQGNVLTTYTAIAELEDGMNRLAKSSSEDDAINTCLELYKSLTDIEACATNSLGLEFRYEEWAREVVGDPKDGRGGKDGSKKAGKK